MGIKGLSKFLGDNAPRAVRQQVRAAFRAGERERKDFFVAGFRRLHRASDCDRCVQFLVSVHDSHKGRRQLPVSLLSLQTEGPRAVLRDRLD
jgi:hypothetical protein